jgi:predicted metal-dependent hydrolase
MRPVLQGILQVAVAQLHLERGTGRGAMILFGEGLGRLQTCGDHALEIPLEPLRSCIRSRLQALQGDQPLQDLPIPHLGQGRGGEAHNL